MRYARHGERAPTIFWFLPTVGLAPELDGGGGGEHGNRTKPRPCAYRGACVCTLYVAESSSPVVRVRVCALRSGGVTVCARARVCVCVGWGGKEKKNR